MPDIILFMAASFSVRYVVSAGNAASVSAEQTVNGETTEAGRLSQPARNAATPTTAMVGNKARMEIATGEKDIMLNPRDGSMIRPSHLTRDALTLFRALDPGQIFDDRTDILRRHR